MLTARVHRRGAATVTAGVLLCLAAPLLVTPAAAAAPPQPSHAQPSHAQPTRAQPTRAQPTPPVPGPPSAPVPIGPGAGNGAGTTDLTWSVSPVRAADGTTRSAFAYDVEPGQVVPDTARISNFANRPLDLQVYAHDGLTTRAVRRSPPRYRAGG